MPFRRPQTALEAKFSLEFAVACALTHGAVGLAQLRDEVVRDPALQALMRLIERDITLEFDPAYRNAAPFDFTTIAMADGTTFRTPDVRRAGGHADKPLSPDELKAKFDDCAAYGGVGAVERDALFSAMQSIDRLPSVDALPRVAGRAG